MWKSLYTRSLNGNHSSIGFAIIQKTLRQERVAVRSDHTAAINRAEEILSQPVGAAINPEGETSLVAAYLLVGVLCDNEYTFVAENGRIKWRIRTFARYLDFDDALTRNALKSCMNANLYDSSGLCCRVPGRLRQFKTPLLRAVRADLLDKIKKYRPPIQLLPFETKSLSSDQKETLRQLLVLDYQTRLFMRDLLEGRRRSSPPEAKRLMRPLAVWHSGELEIAARLLA